METNFIEDTDAPTLRHRHGVLEDVLMNTGGIGGASSTTEHIPDCMNKLSSDQKHTKTCCQKTKATSCEDRDATKPRKRSPTREDAFTSLDETDDVVPQPKHGRHYTRPVMELYHMWRMLAIVVAVSILVMFIFHRSSLTEIDLTYRIKNTENEIYNIKEHVRDLQVLQNGVKALQSEISHLRHHIYQLEADLEMVKNNPVIKVSDTIMSVIRPSGSRRLISHG